MLSSMGIQTASRNHVPNGLFSPNEPQNLSILKNPSISVQKRKLKPLAVSASSSSLAEESSSMVDDRNQGKKKLAVVVKAMEKPRLVLKFVWMEKNIGIAIDQVIPGGRGTIPVSPYYFWPRKDAWEELKVMLESKSWISERQIVVLLNHATEIINLWQQSGGS